jgi:hypothetical protein
MLSKILSYFNIGYGDKVTYWIATTLAQEDFRFEPYLAGAIRPTYFIGFCHIRNDMIGQYGNCGGVLMHYDPLHTDYKNPDDVKPFFINAEQIVENLATIGKYVQQVMTAAVLIAGKLDESVNECIATHENNDYF